ncbi:hypothetical protein [Delftia sp. GW456-R20]|uniref:hypothetical protein n=1 Tax=Delftia sp. GW456-R20 TaxID=1827145 RepID=UPI0012E974B4|nr:hypothetical protein [Delftia sp. GW456-R20]
MNLIIPNSSWHAEKSKEKKVQNYCSYAALNKCHRFYESIYLLTKKGVIAGLDNDAIDKLDKYWEGKSLIPLIEEERTSVTGNVGKISSMSNFCPEVTHKYYGYYASYMSKYVDDIDAASGERRAVADDLKDDWRFLWQFVVACHYLDCSVFNQVKEFNLKTGGRFDELIHSNIKSQIAKMELCLDNQDYPGVVHASANVLETLGKDVLNDPALQNKTLGSFLLKYEKQSHLPDEIKQVVGQIYNLRNRTPMAGHGSTSESNIIAFDAVLICAATKFIVEIEYRSRAIS